MRVFAGLATLILLVALPLGAAQAEDRPARTVGVQGSGMASAVPDIAQVTLGVTTADATAQRAIAANGGAVTRIFDYLKGAGVADTDIQTAGLSVGPRFRDRRTGEPQAPEITGYVVRNQVRVTVRDLTALGAVLDGVIVAGANEVAGISFDVAERERLSQEALADAVKNARARAQVLAEAAGVTLGPVIEITEGGGGAPRPMLARAEASGLPVAPGSLSVGSNVSVLFEIR